MVDEVAVCELAPNTTTIFVCEKRMTGHIASGPVVVEEELLELVYFPTQLVSKLFPL